MPKVMEDLALAKGQRLVKIKSLGELGSSWFIDRVQCCRRLWPGAR